MRVAMVSWEYPPLVVGGLAAHVHGLATAMVRAGHEVVVLTRAHPYAPDDSVVEGVRVLRAHVDLPWVPNDNPLAQVISGNHQVAQLGAGMLPWQADVVHAHDWLGAWAGDTLREAYGAPFVATIHATELGRHQGHLTNTTSEAINAAEWWLTYEAQRGDLLLGVHGRGGRARRSSSPGDKIAMVPNGVDPISVPHDRCDASGHGCPAHRVLGAARVREGLPDAHRRGRCGSSPAIRPCAACSSGEAPTPRSCGVSLAASASQQSVQFAGFVSDEELVRLLNEATCAVIPSLYEPFGIVALEALSAGAPLIAAESGGLREVLSGTEAGLLFPPGQRRRARRGVRAHDHRAGSRRAMPGRGHPARRDEVLVGRDRGVDDRRLPRRRRQTDGQGEENEEGRQTNVKALRSFTVRARLPESLTPLVTPRAEPALVVGSRDPRPVPLGRPRPLGGHTARPGRCPRGGRPERLQGLSEDPGFLRFLSDTDDELTRYLTNDRWFQLKGRSPLQLVGYFSPEFGISEALPQYSGGLGVLAGDHLKAASDLGVPLVGVGLFYRHGYFRQSLSPTDGSRSAIPTSTRTRWRSRCATACGSASTSPGARCTPRSGGPTSGARRCTCSTPTSTTTSPTCARSPTASTAATSSTASARRSCSASAACGCCDALGLDAQVFHTNEGHAGFLGLERMHRLIAKEGLSFAEAVEAVRAAALFTTHTPVPAGIDRFPRELMEHYFAAWASECGSPSTS